MENVTLHVRFASDGTVAEISERPAGLTPQQWFNRLSEAIGMKAYQTFAGGRGVFKVARDQVEALKTAVA
ncbi:conserved hypothetical protein [Bradyrhizobium sp. STM 3843]|uniref:hypothetical protein n=1 Tax=unclassified Bradyrhizobium TaxID=2631580 RepID=UPI0002403CF7|nr:hypothetical protein [Bradyrhizobium sp. STM 3843]CCE09102.1 conserved hypothetical protein [Bradyrhizobium sp. STM 3843]